MGAPLFECARAASTRMQSRHRRADPHQPRLQLRLPGISIGGHIGGLIGGSLAVLALQAADRARQPALGYAALLALAAVAAVAGVVIANHGGL